jgi:hypothetical protein
LLLLGEAVLLWRLWAVLHLVHSLHMASSSDLLRGHSRLLGIDGC